MLPFALFALLCALLFPTANATITSKGIQLLKGARTFSDPKDPNTAIQLYSLTPLKLSKSPMQQWIVTDGTRNVTLQQLTEGRLSDGRLIPFTGRTVSVIKTNDGDDANADYNVVLVRKVDKKADCDLNGVFYLAEESLTSATYNATVSNPEHKGERCPAVVLSPRYGNESSGITLSFHDLGVQSESAIISVNSEFYGLYSFNRSSVATWNNTATFGQLTFIVVPARSTYSFGFSATPPAENAEIVVSESVRGGIFMSPNAKSQNLAIKVKRSDGKKMDASVYIDSGTINANSLLEVYTDSKIFYNATGAVSLYGWSTLSGGPFTTLSMRYVPSSVESGRFMIRYYISNAGGSGALCVALLIGTLIVNLFL